MTNEQPEAKNQSESTSGYFDGLRKFAEELQTEEKLIGSLLVGILALLIPVIPSVPPERRVLVWFATIILVLLIFLIFHYWTKSSASKLSQTTRDAKNLRGKVYDLRTDYRKLATSNNNRLSEVDHQIQKVREDIARLSNHGSISKQEADSLIQRLIELAEDIRKQINQNSSDISIRIEAGINTVENAAEIARKLAESDN